MRFSSYRLPWLLLLCGVAVYATAVHGLRAIPRPPLDERLRLAMPAYVQVLLAGGDKYLASNLEVFRAVTLSAVIADPNSYAIQAKIQQQANLLNPYNQDNAYLAAAVLAWEGQVEIAQWILNRTTIARDWDPEPPFYQGFNAYYFDKDYERAGELALIAAERADGINRRFFRMTASRWFAQTEDKDTAIRLLRILQQTTTDADIQRQLAARIVQTENLHRIQTAMQLYTLLNGRPARQLTDLLEQGYLLVLPRDPFNHGFEVNAAGEVVIRRP